MEKKQIQILRKLINEMSWGGPVDPVVSPYLGKPADERPPMASGRRGSDANDARLQGYYASKLFAKRAESFFRDPYWPYPVYVLPYIGNLTDDQYISITGKHRFFGTPGKGAWSQGPRSPVMNMEVGLQKAEQLGFDISQVKDRSGFVICAHSLAPVPEQFSLWVMGHAMFDGSNRLDDLIDSADVYGRAYELMQMMLEPLDGDPDGSAIVRGTFTMKSNRVNGTDEMDTIPEAMTQELFERHRGGFRTLDHMREYTDSGGPRAERPLTDEEREIIAEFSECIKICAAEFVKNCQGKVIFVNV
jgi:hypothetical protein